MSWLDWIGAVLFVPLLLALATLIVYLTIGLIGSPARRRRIAEEAEAKRASTDETRPKRAARRVPGD
jgi:hypothetical protein